MPTVCSSCWNPWIGRASICPRINVIHINKRGTLTLPKEMRRRLGIDRNAQVVAEETGQGILLRPGATFPVELYARERLAQQCEAGWKLEGAWRSNY
jgi:bifunctional DNA-binding transcriptional regulator/antitoxin component of YhaV-PrlF toxin-antitoxin module